MGGGNKLILCQKTIKEDYMEDQSTHRTISKWMGGNGLVLLDWNNNQWQVFVNIVLNLII
jgi:hypothetical protein